MNAKGLNKEDATKIIHYLAMQSMASEYYGYITPIFMKLEEAKSQGFPRGKKRKHLRDMEKRYKQIGENQMRLVTNLENIFPNEVDKLLDETKKFLDSIEIEFDGAEAKVK